MFLYVSRLHGKEIPRKELPKGGGIPLKQSLIRLLKRRPRSLERDPTRSAKRRPRTLEQDLIRSLQRHSQLTDGGDWSVGGSDTCDNCVCFLA